MMRYMANKVLEKEAEKKVKENKKFIMYTGMTVLAGIGAYVSYKAIKNYIFDKEMDEDLDYLESLSEDEYYDDYDNEEKELKEKIDEFNSKRLNHENDEIVSPRELNHYVEQIKVDKGDEEIEENFEEDRFEKYDE